MPNQSGLIAFYRGLSPDNRGRFIDEILHWDYSRLEGVHDFIQWLFPLAEQSAFNRSAPLLTPSDIKAFRDSEELRANLTRAFDVMLGFYGFQRQGMVIEKSADYEDRAANWVRYANHNFLRITRILKSLCSLGLRELAEAFLRALGKVYAEHYDQVGTSYSYWQNALR